MKTTEDRVAQRKTRIFLVDDESDILIFYKRGLEQGFLVDAFNDPVQALLAFKANKYDLVLLDIKMPRMNGFTGKFKRSTATSRYASSPHSFHTTNLKRKSLICQIFIALSKSQSI